MTKPHGNFISLKTISRTINLEESRLRYYEKIFASCLPPKITQGNHLVYPANAVEIFQTIHRLQTEGLNEVEIRKQLENQSKAKTITPGKQKNLARILTITSGKGGVGKSSISLNLAIALRRLGEKVVLVDGDFGLANLHLMAGIKARQTLATMIKMDLSILEVITTGPAGIAMIAGASGMAELANLPSYKRSRLIKQLEKLEHIADYIIIDTGSGLAPAVLDLLHLADDIIVIVTPDITSLVDA